MDYIREKNQAAQPAISGEKTCFFCDYREHPERDAPNLVVCRSTHAFAVMNRYPYNYAHLMVAPLAHGGDFKALSAEQLLDCQQLIQKLITVLEPNIRCDGFNVGMNVGEVAGAGVPGHLHWHLVPRWSGDNNFMDVIAGTHIIADTLPRLYENLQEMLKS
jgi:ATP adenylyltransferase